MGRVRLRLARYGRKKRPFYRIVAADNHSPRDGRFIEILGFYDPLVPKDSERRVKVNIDRAKYWLSVGAETSDTVRGILTRTGVMEPSPKMRLNSASPPVTKAVTPTARLRIPCMITKPLAMLKI
eukprot:TRINITY_DN37713_c0_g1_i1.p1 TRINITY_DN37713_c0_g1~~TRINITY_DN37713_c0_g1_i1.p1  ORF type:complete len:125 (-),score=11.88 TRINITY_DN37713_c0_g1_i1:427-801(-)